MASQNPYRIVEEPGQRILEIDYSKSVLTPSIAESEQVMADTINKLVKAGKVSQIMFKQQEDYIYPLDQTTMLLEVANIITEFIERTKLLSEDFIKVPDDPNQYADRMEFLKSAINYGLREDPVAAYLRVVTRLQTEKSRLNFNDNLRKDSLQIFITTLNSIRERLETLSILKLAQPYFQDHRPGSRAIYSRFLNPIIKPNFLYAKLVTKFPTGAQELDSYKLPDGSKVVMLRLPDEIRPVYHITPPEFSLTEDRYALLGEAKRIVAEHEPQKSEFIDPKRTSEIFQAVEQDLLRDLSTSRGIKLKEGEVEQLAQILVRHTLGFGMVEIILGDTKIQDISVNAPSNLNQISVVHADHGECITNITLTNKEVEGWATKLRLISGRPLDEANPVLDTSINLANATARVSAIQAPLSPQGLAFSFRRHRNRPWTFPLFIENKMINPLAAALISFLIDGGRTMLFAGTRSSGKTSLLSAAIVELMRSTRIITVEDTLELPISKYQDLNYDIQSMKVQSAITQGESELTATDGIRTSLRLGDSALIVGEVRSKEAVALYEAMRVGALANVVMGTIHGDSPYSIYDRVVNDLKVPKTSFKATDIIIVSNPVKSASGIGKLRRLIQISEVRKEWEDDPLKEHAFVDLMVYNPKTDTLEPTDALIQGESVVLKSIASRVAEWVGDWDAVWENIKLREKIKSKIVELGKENPELLEAETTIQANDMFHRISEDIFKKEGRSDPEKIYQEWEAWMTSKVTKS